MSEHIVDRVAGVLREDSNPAANKLAELLSKRQTELGALCRGDVNRLQEIINLYKDPGTRDLSELLIGKANGLAHLCAGDDFFDIIINLAIDKNPAVKSLGELLITNSFDLVFLHKQIGEDVIPKIIELYSGVATRDLAEVVMNRALDLATLCMEDKRFFENVVTNAANPDTILVLQSSLDTNAKTIETSEPLHMHKAEAPPQARGAQSAFVDSLSATKTSESPELGSPNSFVAKISAQPSQGRASPAA